MMNIRGNPVLSFMFLTVVMSSVGCHRRIGPPNDQDELMRPDEVVSFDRLYTQNCSACHGENGSGGPAFDLANSGYQALVDDESLKRTITSGMPGTEMPAFGESAGGFLTPQQVAALVAGMRSRWGHADQHVTDVPPYSSNAIGAVEHGQWVFQESCSTCHQQVQKKITDTGYLALVSDQSLRTIVIAGRPDLGQPDYKQVRPGRPLTDQDVSDVIAYLHSLRSDTPGQPYPETNIKR
jgi:mono/diheme cytochrome c family protein